MVVIRFLAVFFIMIALMLMGADVVSTLEMPGGLVVRSLARILLLVQVDAKTLVQQNFPPSMAGVSLTLLDSPATVVFGTIGIVFALLGLTGRREERPSSKSPPIHR